MSILTGTLFLSVFWALSWCFFLLNPNSLFRFPNTRKLWYVFMCTHFFSHCVLLGIWMCRAKYLVTHFLFLFIFLWNQGTIFLVSFSAECSSAIYAASYWHHLFRTVQKPWYILGSKQKGKRKGDKYHRNYVWPTHRTNAFSLMSSFAKKKHAFWHLKALEDSSSLPPKMWLCYEKKKKT